jgi:nucleotidyltransferase/DNA polymerase involved in DNA repair
MNSNHNNNNNTQLKGINNIVKNAIKQQCGGLLSSIGVAPTKSTAKIASDFKRPDGS